jgi:transcription antitermination factor NusA-like protein
VSLLLIFLIQNFIIRVADIQNMRADEIILTCESIVPSKVVGRIIGKNGQNVKIINFLYQYFF